MREKIKWGGGGVVSYPIFNGGNRRFPDSAHSSFW
jgi:hypothetical protein